eukprot:scaffold661654_cov57-Prasinocladus_malaysianus.AAC.1
MAHANHQVFHLERSNFHAQVPANNENPCCNYNFPGKTPSYADIAVPDAHIILFQYVVWTPLDFNAALHLYVSGALASKDKEAKSPRAAEDESQG